MEQVDSFQLDSQEAACSMCTVSFADDPTEYFAVGTAYVLPEEPEPTKVRRSLSVTRKAETRKKSPGVWEGDRFFLSC